MKVLSNNFGEGFFFVKSVNPIFAHWCFLPLFATIYAKGGENHEKNYHPAAGASDERMFAGKACENQCKPKTETTVTEMEAPEKSTEAGPREPETMRTLTKQVLNELIDHIDVYEVQGTGKNKTQRRVIYYKFVGYLDIDPTQCHPNYTADIREGVAVEYVSCEPTEGMKELFPEQYGEEYEVPEDEETEQA